MISHTLEWVVVFKLFNNFSWNIEFIDYFRDPFVNQTRNESHKTFQIVLVITTEQPLSSS